MHCFNHPDQPAVGVCKACSKGLCVECAVDLGHSITCVGAHEHRAEDIESMLAKNAKALHSSKNMSLAGPFFYLFLAVLFAGAGFFGRNQVDWFLVLFGIGCLLFSVAQFIHRGRVWGKQ